MESKTSQREIKDVFRRRKGIFLKSWLTIFFISIAIALVLPPIYRSEVKIRVEGREIPEEYIESTIKTYVNQRMHMISQKVMIPDNLRYIIEKYNLYPDKDSFRDKFAAIYEDIQIEPEEQSFLDEERGKWFDIITAFTLSYDGKDPYTAQKVADQVANLYIEEDKRTRAKMASSTPDFFQKELENLKVEVLKNEEKISRFKAENIDILPGSLGSTLQYIKRQEEEIDRINADIRTLREKKIYLEAQLASIDPLLPVVTSQGKFASNPQQRLKELRMELIQMKSKLSAKHPDIKTLVSEIDELEARVGNPDMSAEKIKRLAYVKRQLAEMKGELGETHPDVIMLRKEAETLSREIKQQEHDKAIKTLSKQKPDNPVYLTISAQINAADVEIAALLDEKNRIGERLSENRRNAAKAPMIEEEYNKLTLDYKSATDKYQEMLNKLMNSKIAQQMDTSEQGERFIISQTASLPVKPYKPKRLNIMLIGFFIGLGIAFGLVALQENFDPSVRSAEEVESIIGKPVIAKVSFFESPGQKRARRSKRLVIAITMVLIVLCGSFIIDSFLVPLDSVWSTFEERLVEMVMPSDRTYEK